MAETKKKRVQTSRDWGEGRERNAEGEKMRLLFGEEVKDDDFIYRLTQEAVYIKRYTNFQSDGVAHINEEQRRKDSYIK